MSLHMNNPTRTPHKRRACDRCYRHKEKCEFVLHTGPCIRCLRSSFECTTTRSQIRRGRRPGVPKFVPEQSVKVWDVEKELFLQQNGLKLASDVVKSQLLRSRMVPAVPICIPPDSDFSSPDWLLQTSDQLTAVFCAIYDAFMFGPSFGSRFRRAIQLSYHCSPNLLCDIYTAIFTAVNHVKQHSSLTDKHAIAQGAISLTKLRTATIRGIQDAFAVLALGHTLAAFDTVTNCYAPALILRYAISAVKPWYVEMSTSPCLDPLTIPPVLQDTVWCLFHGEVPIIRYHSTNTGKLEQLGGLCVSLLPIYYDLCVASKIFRDQVNSQSKVNYDDLKQIELRLLQWKPRYPQDFTIMFNSQEVICMEAQALMYREAGLLILHRALNPLGTSDDVANAQARSIMRTFSEYSKRLGSGSRLRNVAFPLLVAMCDFECPSEEVWEGVETLTVAKTYVAKMDAFLDYLWSQRHSGSTKFISDLARDAPQICIVP